KSAVGHGIGAEQLGTTWVRNLEVVIAIRQACRLCRRVRTGAAVQVHRALRVILVGVHNGSVDRSCENRARYASGLGGSSHSHDAQGAHQGNWGWEVSNHRTPGSFYRNIGLKQYGGIYLRNGLSRH